MISGGTYLTDGVYRSTLHMERMIAGTDACGTRVSVDPAKQMSMYG